jgi:hypothetical protein
MKIEFPADRVSHHTCDVRFKMTDSPRIPYVLWPVAIVYAFAIAHTVNMIERNWHRPQQRRSPDWRRQAG